MTESNENVKGVTTVLAIRRFIVSFSSLLSVRTTSLLSWFTLTPLTASCFATCINSKFKAARIVEKHPSTSYIEMYHCNSNERLPQITLQIQGGDCHPYHPVDLWWGQIATQHPTFFFFSEAMEWFFSYTLFISPSQPVNIQIVTRKSKEAWGRWGILFELCGV